MPLFATSLSFPACPLFLLPSHTLCALIPTNKGAPYLAHPLRSLPGSAVHSLGANHSASAAAASWTARRADFTARSIPLPPLPLLVAQECYSPASAAQRQRLSTSSTRERGSQAPTAVNRVDRVASDQDPTKYYYHSPSPRFVAWSFLLLQVNGRIGGRQARC